MKHTAPFSVTCTALLLLAPVAHAVDHGDLLRLAERYNQQLPRMVAKNVQEERMTVEAMTLVYTYRHLALPEQSFRSRALAATQRADILPKLCGDRDTGRMLREGVTFRYRYLSADGAVVAIVELADRDCRGRR